MKKEIENKNKKVVDEKIKRRKEFFNLLENKIYDFGKNILKSGISSLAISQINNTEEKIKEELEKKYKKYQNKILKNIFLLLAVSFLAYGILSLTMFKINLSEYTNLIFGLIFLAGYFIFNKK